MEDFCEVMKEEMTEEKSEVRKQADIITASNSKGVKKKKTGSG